MILKMVIVNGGTEMVKESPLRRQHACESSSRGDLGCLSFTLKC
jgi:hypothetical protein